MADIIDFEARLKQLREARAALEHEGKRFSPEVIDQFEGTVDEIIKAMINSPLSLNEMLAAGCVAMIDLLEASGKERADAIATVEQKIGMFVNPLGQPDKGRPQ